MEVRIDRLRLQVAGMNADAARQFSRLAAQRLGASLAALAPAGGPARIGHLHVTIPTPAGASADALAAAMASEISRVLSREAGR